MAAVGGLVWLALLVCVLLNNLPLSTFDLLFLLAPLVVVPLTLRLVPTVQDGPLFGITGRVIRYSLLPGAMTTTASFLLPVGRVAGALNCLWLIVGAALALDGIRLIRTRVQSLQEFCFAVGEGYSLIGALWLLATRLGLKPLSFHEPIVLLTDRVANAL
jgi:YndJ-like protein